MSGCGFVGVDWAEINWGSVPDWLAGIGTVLAFGAIVWQLRRDARAREAAALDERTGVVGVLTGAGKIVVHNNGRMPVSNLLLLRQATDSDRNPVWPEWVPLAHFPFGVPGGGASEPLGIETVQPEHVIRLYFSDVHGRRWARLEDGRLTNDEPPIPGIKEVMDFLSGTNDRYW